VPTPAIAALSAAGQSIWLDFIRRDLLTGGELARMVADGRITGLTSNPTIFEKAIAGSHDYDAALTLLAREARTRTHIFDALANRGHPGRMRRVPPRFERTHGADGFASIEVSPLLARSTDETLAEARRLKKAVDRPNVLVKIPATAEGVPAIRAAIAERDLDQRHAHLLGDRVRAGGRGLPVRARSARGARAGREGHRLGRLVLRQPRRLARRTHARGAGRGGNAAVSGAARALLGKIAVARAAYARFLELSRARGGGAGRQGRALQRPLGRARARRTRRTPTW